MSLIVLCVLSAVSFPAVSHAAPSEAQLLKSMEARLPALMELKLSGKVGENSKALVEARKKLEDSELKIVSEENADRMAHYHMLAERLSVPVLVVQKKRAEQIRSNSPRGIWIQSKTGAWSRE
ncbi:MAG: DUF1318 domain-containing protein [Opitutaceae bacterium]